MADGFLGRWARRKAGKEDEALEEVLEKKIEPHKDQVTPVENISQEAKPPLTLDDVAKMDRFDPDFSAFMKPDVDPAVQQAALKKMFTDPHFNIMDGLDIYIDDYTKPDPLPAGYLARMVQSDLLKLFAQKGSAEEDLAQGESQATQPSLEGAQHDLQKQTDLTSTEQKLSAQLDEAPRVVPIESEEKKT